MNDKITLAHGAGGKQTSELIGGLFKKYFDNPNLTADDAAVLTATQTNRDGFKSTVAKAEHVAEDFNKIRIADLVISINATEEERAVGEARLYFAASRNQETGFSIFIKQEIAKMKFITAILKVE